MFTCRSGFLGHRHSLKRSHSCVCEIHQRGSELIALGVPVQELTALPLLGEARRYKESFGNDRTVELRKQIDAVRDSFDPIRLRYAQAGSAT